MKMMKKTWLALLVLMLLCPQAWAAAYHDAPPSEVLEHLNRNLPDFALEDCILITGTPKGNFAFVLVSNGTSRRLLGYEYKNGRYQYWLRNDGAVPQGAGQVSFYRHRADMPAHGFDSAPFGNDWGFTVSRIAPDSTEIINQQVSYHWENGGFKLYFYMDRDIYTMNWYVFDDSLKYEEFTAGYERGTIMGIVQRDIRHASFATLPKTVREAQEKLSLAPDIPQGELKAQRIKFTGGQKFPVYTGPGTHYLRAGNGKAAVSTNDWIQVFGQENGWILIQYDLSRDRMRMGYIEASALPKNAQVPQLNLNHAAVNIGYATNLTDDPLFSQSALAQLPQGQPVTSLSSMGTWGYIETTVNNTPVRGFVPGNALHMPIPTPAPFPLTDTTPGLVAGTLYNGAMSGENYVAYTSMSLNDARDAFVITIHVEAPDSWHSPQTGTDALLGYQLYENNRAGAFTTRLPDDKNMLVFTASLPISTQAQVVGLVPVFAVSGNRINETITIPLP